MQTLEEEIKLPPWGQEVRQLTQEGVRQENTEWGKAGAKRGALSTAEEQVWVAFCLGSPDRLSRRLMGSDLPLPGVAGPGRLHLCKMPAYPGSFTCPSGELRVGPVWNLPNLVFS